MKLVTLTTLGVLIILYTLRDVVHELFHPEASGSMSRMVMCGVWRMTRAIGKHHRDAVFHAGPAILLAVAFTWAILLMLGWTLIYLPRLPDSFTVDPSLPMSAARGVWTALYVSLASMTTIAASDLTPKGHVVRFAVTLESFVGPLLFTAWITWVLSIYPVIADRRAFALEIDLLRRSNDDPEHAARDVPPEAVVEVLQSLTEQLLHLTVQLRQSRVTYYFQNDMPEATLTRQLPWALAMARAAASRDGPPAIQHHGKMLEAAISDLLRDIGKNFLGGKDGSPEELIRALAMDHLLEDVAEHALD